jgi:uncharacterized protein
VSPLQAEPLIAGGPASGPWLPLAAPISFWGGVDPASSRIIDARHPDRGRAVSGAILALPGTIGSSSASAVLLELIRAGLAPAAIVLDQPDAILLLGCIVAREMGWAAPPAFRLAAADQRLLADGRIVAIAADGVIVPR